MRTLIHHAEIADGSGEETYRGWLLIEGGYIADLGQGEPHGIAADAVIDAEGLCLAPGFIDAHTHSDMTVFDDPAAESVLAQGVTTHVTGNCGLSPFPVTALNRAHLESLYARVSQPLEWTDFTSYAETVDRARPAINIVPQVGHNTLRAAVTGYHDMPVGNAQIEAMRDLLKTTLSQGACGLSLGLLYVPGVFASTDEIVALLAEMRGCRKPLNAHLRNESGKLLEAVAEMFEFQQRAELPKIHISHLKTARPANWSKIDALLEMVAGRSGLTVDRYPYTASMTSLSIVAPAPYDEMPDREIQQLLQEKEHFMAMADALETRPADYWKTVRLADVTCGRYLPYRGKRFDEIVSQTNVAASVIYTEILREDAVNAMGAFEGMDVDNMKRIIALENCVCGSDEQLRKTDGSMGRGHPRGCGSFPRFFRFASEYSSRGKVIRKMSALTADIFNIPERGYLKTGYVADLVLFDPENYRDHADFNDPLRTATGVRTVWVGGKKAWDAGRPTSERAGKTLRIP